MQTSKDSLEEDSKAGSEKAGPPDQETAKDSGGIPTVDNPSPQEGDIDPDSLDIPILTDVYHEEHEDTDKSE